MTNLAIQIAALTSLAGVVVSFVAWSVVGGHIKESSQQLARPVRLMDSYFLLLALYFLIIWLPHISLMGSPQWFPALMAGGFVISHTCWYFGLIQVLRMLTEIQPSLNRQKVKIVAASAAVAAGLTLVTAIALSSGQPAYYDYEQFLPRLNLETWLSIIISLATFLVLLPATWHFLTLAHRADLPANRWRFGLMGAGLALQVGAVPVRELATTWQLLVIADGGIILGVAILAVGFMYRIDQPLSNN